MIGKWLREPSSGGKWPPNLSHAVFQMRPNREVIMNRISVSLCAAAAMVSTAANSETWVQYDIYGSGSYSSVDVSQDPALWHWGHARFSGTFFVEVDPTNDDSLNYYSDGKFFTQWDWFDPTFFYNVNAGNSMLSIGYGYNDGDCGHAFCEDAEISLKFAPGSFDTLPTSFAHFQNGTINYSESGHWWSLDASGRVWRVSAKIVSAPGQSGFGVSTTQGALPEPTSWAMMLSGFGPIGGAMRGRRRTAVGFA